MRCPSCNKFATYDDSQEPEVELDARYADDGIVQVSGSVRIVLTAECCGDELKEASFDIDDETGVERKCECESFCAEVVSAEITSRQESTSIRTKKDGTVVVKDIPYRYRRTFYGVSVGYEVVCDCGATKGEGEFSDEVQASGMDELV